MDKKGTKAWLFMGALGFGLGAMSPLRAAPPVTPASTARPETSSHPLDLHLSAAMIPDPDKESAAAFPTSLHRAMLGGGNAEPARLGPGDAHPTRIPGGVEAFAQRVRREGLPVARLWQNKAAVVSLGLNQKGKPGLWLMQRVP